jgi:hypothetical protein
MTITLTHLEMTCDLAVRNRRYHNNGKSHYGLKVDKRTDNLDCYRKAIAQLTDEERIDMDSIATILIEKVPGMGGLGALELLAKLGMLMVEKEITSKCHKYSRELKP